MTPLRVWDVLDRVRDAADHAPEQVRAARAREILDDLHDCEIVRPGDTMNLILDAYNEATREEAE